MSAPPESASGSRDANGIRHPLLARLPLGRGRPWIGIAAALGLTAVALAVRLLLDDVLPPAFPFVTIFPAIVVSTFLFGLRAGLVATATGYILSRIYFIEVPGGRWLAPGMVTAMLLYATVAAFILASIHLMQRAYEELAREREVSRKLADTRELLMREMHHRVGNHLQMLASLLALQKRKVREPEALHALDEASRRIGLVGRVQRQLHNAEIGEVALAQFIDQLCRDLIDASGRQDVRHTVREDARCQLSSELAVPVALVVAEAVSNAIEHGFGERRGGSIDVSLEREDGNLVIRIDDDGCGLPDGFATRDRTSLGLTIATLLARGVGGQFRLEPGVGARAVLCVPFSG